MKPLLAHIYEPHRVTYPCYVQPKLNGIRALYQNGHFQSRDEQPFPPGLLDHLATPLLELFDEKVILDGELYVHGWPLQRINAAVTPVRLKPTEDTSLVQYHIFDRVDYGLSFYDRMRLVWPLHSKLHIVETFEVSTVTEADELYVDFVRQNYEGMMYRLRDCPYTLPKQPQLHAQGRNKFLSDKDNRVWHLLKRKDWQDFEFECHGVQEGEGKYKGTLGAFECISAKLDARGDIEGWNTFTVGSGLTDAERDYYWENRPIGKLIKVKYLVLSSDGIPLNPTVLAVL